MLTVENISFEYENRPILKNISFKVAKAEHLSVIGTSGSGKSTLLKALYGLIDLSQGSIKYGQSFLKGPSYNILPGHKQMKYLAQDFQLMPYISVAENVGNFISNLNLSYKKTRIEELLDMVGILQYANEKPFNLSGGEQQRAALAMALANEPEVLLLDEPFSHIDSHKKNPLRRTLFEYLKHKKITTIVATHENNEALSFADNILVLNHGEIVAYGSPLKLYQNPPSEYVASLFGEINHINISQTSYLLYPHQFAVHKNGKYSCKVIKSYFQGKHFLTQCIFNENTIYMDTEQSYPQGSILYFDIVQT